MGIETNDKERQRMSAKICDLLDEADNLTIAHIILIMRAKECSADVKKQMTHMAEEKIHFKPPSFWDWIFFWKEKERSINEIILKWRIEEFEKAKKMLEFFEKTVQEILQEVRENEQATG